MQVFYSQMCALIKLGLNGRVFQRPLPRRAFFVVMRVGFEPPKDTPFGTDF